MTGSESIDLSLKNICDAWFSFRRGKKATMEVYRFRHKLERNLYMLWKDLNSGQYRHGGYRKFVVSENKRREVSVASLRDRVVHRLLYEYLTAIYDQTFIYDVWSCRLGKGLLGAVERAQLFLKNTSDGFVWRADVKKFFDSVDHQTLLKILARKVRDPKAYALLRGVIDSFALDRNSGGGWVYLSAISRVRSSPTFTSTNLIGS